jgi:site-specific DNA-methyltransferase (adenine-specific)
MTCAIEDAGFEVRDCLAWFYGAAMPIGTDVSKALDKHVGAERQVVGWRRLTGTARPNAGGGGTGFKGKAAFAGRGEYVPVAEAVIPITAPASPAAVQWDGWHTALRPAHEPIVLARKPLVGSMVQNVLAHGAGPINARGCQLEGGQWPPNVILDEAAAAVLDAELGREAPRFFYCPKASTEERSMGLPPGGNVHLTVKPLALMRWLCRLVVPPGGTVLDPFTGSGTTGMACVMEGFDFIGVELQPEYHAIALARIAAAHGAAVESAKASRGVDPLQNRAARADDEWW